MALRIMRQWWGARGNYEDLIQENIDDTKDWNYMLANVMIYDNNNDYDDDVDDHVETFPGGLWKTGPSVKNHAIFHSRAAE